MNATGRYDATFARLAHAQEGAFVPFLVLGDPDPATSLELVRALARSGADALELGLPFSDPIADGPVIQAASTRALAAGTRIRDAWQIVSEIRREFPDLPLGMLVYANLVFHQGVDRFYGQAASAGADSVLVADAPLLESAALARAARAHGIAPTLIVPADARAHRVETIAAGSEAYVYVTSRSGVTGADARLRQESAAVFARLRELGSAPALLGFGIATPDQVRQALDLGAAGAICGSAVVSHIPRMLGQRPALADALAGFAQAMKQATRPLQTR